MFSISNAPGRDMAGGTASSGNWLNWCRLCAREDELNRNIYLREDFVHNEEDMTTERLISVIKEYFNVEIQMLDTLPQNLCIDCLSFLRTLISFQRRVLKVQQMYAELKNLSEAKNIETQALRLKCQLMDTASTEESMLAAMVIKKEEENVTTAVKGMCDFQSDEAIFINHEEEKEVPTTDGIHREEAMLIKQEEVDEVATADESVCEFQSEEAMVIKQQEVDEVVTADESVCHLQIVEAMIIKQEDEEEEVVTADESMCDFQSEEAADCENTPCGTASEDEVEYRDAKEDYSEADMSEAEATEKQATAEYKYFCMKCPRRFQFKSAYSTHLSIKHGIMVKPTYDCSTCQQNFKDCYSLTRHMKAHRPEAEGNVYPCPHCDRKLKSMHSVRAHIRFVHKISRPLKCEVCGAVMRTQRNLREHMETHRDYAPFECDVCKKCFKTQERLKNHMNTHSTGKHTICSECGLKLSSRTSLNQHMVLHSDVMKYGCDYCGRTFKHPNSYRTHLMRHCGFKPHSCEFCDMAFTNSSNCRSHMSRNHPSEFAEMQKSGEWKPTKNIPTLDVLKAIMSKGENLVPVPVKGRKPKTQTVVADCAKKSDEPQKAAVAEDSEEF